MTQQKLDSYLSLSTQFYDVIRPKPPEDAYAFYRSYVVDVNGLILEPMCGSGRFLLPLIEEGFEVHGFDASEHMLDALHTKAKVQHLKPNVWPGFVEDLKRPEKYNLIFIPSGSFGHIIDLNSVKTALKLLYDHLNNDGILLFEAESSKSVPTQLGIWRGDWVSGLAPCQLKQTGGGVIVLPYRQKARCDPESSHRRLLGKPQLMNLNPILFFIF